VKGVSYKKLLLESLRRLAQHKGDMQKIILTICLGVFAGCATEPKEPDMQRVIRESRERDAQKKEDYIASHPDLSAEKIAAIRANKIVLGMTPSEVYAAWGMADAVHKSVTARGTRETHVYRYRQAYLFFNEDGVLESWNSY
jgi:hypothetical protein